MKVEMISDYKGRKIPSTELTQMGLRIQRFVENYRKYVTIHCPNTYKKDPYQLLHSLEDISHKLITRQYAELFDDTSIVDLNDDGVPF